MKILNEVRKEDDVYYQGAFWIIGSSVKDIKCGSFTIIGEKLESDYEGNYTVPIQSKSGLTHKRLWQKHSEGNEDKPYNYFPRGRVAIYKGTAFIHLNSLFNQPDIIDTVIEQYNLRNLDIEIENNDQTQGSHYDFLLE